ncbi:MAG TPA: hypothetical protein VL221_07015 [Bacteroidota bacterium]|nr:hypothetical protein [Bacteroidota bacterium]
MTSPLYTLDVGHPARHPDIVEDLLLEAWERVRNSPALRVIKVIHGYGSGGKGGSTREVVRNWLFRHRERFRGIVYGEEYDPQNSSVQSIRKEIGHYDDPDLTFPNPGITIIWVK